jgi:hypothetical protein
VADAKSRFPDGLRLNAGVSLSQTRFALANFCLNHFGADGQYYADVIELCADAARLQEALNIIVAEVAKSRPDRMPVLIACVREANDTDPESSGTTLPRATPQPQVPSSTPARTAAAAGATRAAGAAQPPTAVTDPLRLAPGISLAQARFALSEFCLDVFGARSQQLVDAINASTDVRAVEGILGGIATEVQAHRREALQRLFDCVREINATGE